MVIPAAMDTTRWLLLTTGPMSSRTIDMTWGLTARIIISDPLTACLFSEVVFIPNASLRWFLLSSDKSDAVIRPGFKSSLDNSPFIRASAICPPPTNPRVSRISTCSFAVIYHLLVYNYSRPFRLWTAMECENYPCIILGIGLLLNSCFKLDLATSNRYNKKKTLNMVNYLIC